MNDAYTDVYVGAPAPPPITQHPLWAAAPAGMEQYWAWNDPRWGSWGIDPESMKYPISDVWDQLLKSAGFQGKLYEEGWRDAYDEVGNIIAVPSTGGRTPEAKAAMDQLRAAGYDVRQKHPDRRTFNTYYGVVTPQGVQDVKIKGSDMGTALKEMIKFAPYMLAFAGGAAGLNALLGGAGAGAGIGAGTAVGATNALTPAAIEAGLGTAGYGFNAGAAASGAFAPTAIGAGAALPFDSILSSGGGALTATDIVSGLDDVLSAASDTATGAEGVVEGANLAGQAAEAATSPYSLSSGATSGTTGITPGAGGTTGITPVTTTPLGAATGAAIDIAPALGTSLGATASALPVGSSLGATTSALAGGGGSILDQAIDLLKTPAGQAVVGGVGSVISGVMQADAAKDVAQQQAGAAENALKLQREMFEYQKSLLEPYRKTGEAALGRLSGAMGLGGPAQQQQMLEMDPGYGFRLGEGMKALERMQAARGNMLSGGALKAGTEYAQKFASGEYENAFNRLADIAGIGRSTAAQQGTAAQQFGQTAGQTGMDVANALAAGRYGRTSAYTGALEGALGAYENYLNRQQRNQVYRDIYGRMLGGGS